MSWTRIQRNLKTGSGSKQNHRIRNLAPQAISSHVGQKMIINQKLFQKILPLERKDAGVAYLLLKGKELYIYNACEDQKCF